MNKGRIFGLAMTLILLLSLAVVPGVAGAAINVPPVAQAGPDQAVHQTYAYDGTDVTLGGFEQVTLDGSGSYDQNGDNLSYEWTFIDAPAGSAFAGQVFLTESAMFTPDEPGRYEVELVVTDDGAPPRSNLDAGQMETVVIIAGSTWFVSIEGNDGWTGTEYLMVPTTMIGPFRTITHAVNSASDGDRILVGPTTPTTHYGGSDPDIEENIDIDKWLTVQSLEGYADTLIDVSDQSPIPQVVLITANQAGLGFQWGPMGAVVFGCDGHGFTVRGACTGIKAIESDFVYIHDNFVDLNECCENETGIEVARCKMPVIDENWVTLRCAGLGTGIVCADCPVSAWGGAQVTDNRVIVETELTAEGIILINCPKSYVGPESNPRGNVIDVRAGVSSMAVGIGLYNGCDLTVVEGNDLWDDSDAWGDWGVFAEGDCCAAAIGIEALDSKAITIRDNKVQVLATSVAGIMGGSLAVGIHTRNCPTYLASTTVVDMNTVDVKGEGRAQVNGVREASFTGVEALGAEELDNLQATLDEITGGQLSVNMAGSLVLGIVDCGSDLIDIEMNTVTADSYTHLTSEGEVAISEGAALSFGIAVMCSLAPDIMMNQVMMTKAYVDAKVTADDGDPVGLGMGAAVAMGITVALCPPDMLHGLMATIEGNNVADVHGHVESLVQSMSGQPAAPAEAGDSVVETIDSEVLNVIQDVIQETADSEEVDVEVQGEPKSLETAIADGSSLAIGVGIAALMSDGVEIIGNGVMSGVMGRATVDQDVYAIEWTDGEDAVAAGGGVAIGIGILDVMCAPTTISNNYTVMGAGDANVNTESAAMIGAPGAIALAESCAFGVGLGILAIGAVSDAQAEETDPECFLPTTAYIIENQVVTADGMAVVLTQAFDRIPDGDAFGFGTALGLAGGIIVACHWCPVIMDNNTNADAEGKAEVLASAISTIDPLALGVGMGLAVGIATVKCPGAEIMGNIADAYGYGEGDVGAVERMMVVAPQVVAEAAGTSMGVGIGIMVAMSSMAKVSDNTATGVGDCDVEVIAEQWEPLDEAFAWALGVGMGKGIVIAFQCCACVKESNVFEAGSNVVVYGEAIGDYAHACSLGFAIAVDASIILVPHGVAFNYNDMPGMVGSSLMVNNIPLPAMDWGMLALISDVDARYNWWGDPTGPSGMGFGVGQAIYWCDLCTRVEFEPWLWDFHAPMLQNHIGKFGFAICLDRCWNTFSTPIWLDDSVDTWGELVEFSPDLIPGQTIGAALEWNGSAWVPAGDLTPLKGIYVFVEEPTCAILLASTEDSWPTRVLGQGWSLIGPNPPFCDGGMEVYAALRSIEQTSDGLPGYTQIVSPPVSGQDSWYWVPGMSGPGDSPWMQNGKAYWVWMENSDTLVGFGFTPIELYPCGEWHCPSPCR